MPPPESTASLQAAFSDLDSPRERFLARIVSRALGGGWRISEDFLEYFPPKAIVHALAHETDVRVRLLVETVGIHPKIAEMLSPEGAAEDLTLAVETGIADARTVLGLVPLSKRIQHLDHGKLWSFAVDGDWLEAADSDPQQRHRAVDRVEFIIQSAIAEELISFREVTKTLGAEKIADRMSSEQLRSAFAHALECARRGTPPDEERLLGSSEVISLIEHAPLSEVWNDVVLETIAKPQGLLDDSSSYEFSSPPVRRFSSAPPPPPARAAEPREATPPETPPPEPPSPEPPSVEPARAVPRSPEPRSPEPPSVEPTPPEPPTANPSASPGPAAPDLSRFSPIGDDIVGEHTVPDGRLLEARPPSVPPPPRDRPGEPNEDTTTMPRPETADDDGWERTRERNERPVRSPRPSPSAPPPAPVASRPRTVPPPPERPSAAAPSAVSALRSVPVPPGPPQRSSVSQPPPKSPQAVARPLTAPPARRPTQPPAPQPPLHASQPPIRPSQPPLRSSQPPTHPSRPPARPSQPPMRPHSPAPRALPPPPARTSPMFDPPTSPRRASIPSLTEEAELELSDSEILLEDATRPRAPMPAPPAQSQPSHAPFPLSASRPPLHDEVAPAQGRTEADRRQEVSTQLRAIDRLPPNSDYLSLAILRAISRMYDELPASKGKAGRAQCVRECFANESHLRAGMLALLDLLNSNLARDSPGFHNKDNAALVDLFLEQERAVWEHARQGTAAPNQDSRRAVHVGPRRPPRPLH